MKSKLDLLIKLVFFFSIVLLSLGFLYLYTKVNNQSETIVSEQTSNVDLAKPLAVNETEIAKVEVGCQKECKEEISRAVSEAVATLSGDTKETVVVKQAVVTQTTGGSDFIPMGTTYSTTSTDWVDVPDSTVYFDLINDYGKDATVSWEASLKVANSNGKAFARLYDGTHNIAVDFSEISTENNADFERVTTGSLPFWRGHNLYKVQIKSLNSLEVTYSGGKIKVSY